MCWMCDQKSFVRDPNGLSSLGASPGEALALSAHFGRYSKTDLTTGFATDGWGDGVGDSAKNNTQAPEDLAATAVLIDEVPNNTSTPITLTVGGPRYVSTPILLGTRTGIASSSRPVSPTISVSTVQRLDLRA